jgi:uncharacterized repeat protein (TIGR01451 family)
LSVQTASQKYAHALRFCLVVVVVLFASVFQRGLFAAPVNDAYQYEDSFADNTGIDLTSTGFVNLGGSQTAKSKTNELISGCFELPGPVGSVFTGWSFAEVQIDDLTQVETHTLHVESCDGATGYVALSPPVGRTSFDLSGLPVSASQIRFRWQIKYQGNGGSRTAAISLWKALGTSTGVTGLQITPSAMTVESNSDVAFALGLSSNSVTTKNPLLSVDLNVLNGTPGTGTSGIGLATDATVCYDLNSDGIAGAPDTECQRYRPIEFLSASDGTSGEPVNLSALTQPTQVPATSGPTDGKITWQLNDLPDGYAGSISVNLHVPQGYIDGKKLALAATLEFGETSTDGTLNNYQSVTAQSSDVNVVSAHAGSIRAWSPYGNVAPGAENVYDNYYLRNFVAQNTNPSDHENITVVIDANGASTCVPTFRSATVTSRYNWPATVDLPAMGAALDTNPVTVKFFRASYVNDSSNARSIVRYDVPATCANGTRVRTEAQVSSPAPVINDTRTRTHNVVFEACRSGYNHMHRIQTGLLVENNYTPAPAWPEYYINNGSLRPGEYFSTWSPYGDSTYRTHTIVLDKSYAVIDVPDTATFHGYRTRRREDTDSAIFFFKDPDGSAPNPVDVAFNNNFDPATESPAAGWYPVERDWTGPFASYTGSAVDNTNPSAVVGPGGRILVVKTNDNTSSGASDYGLFRTQAVWRVCDGDFGCGIPASNSTVQVTGNMFTYQQTQSPFVRQCASMSGYRAYTEAVSYPKVYASAEQQNVQAGAIASIIVTPHNSNYASQYVDGRWSIDLSDIADNIDLDNVTGEVLTDGLNLPGAGQNVAGQSCSASDIAFVAPTSANPIAYWDVPAQCQIPNGWGYRIDNNTSQDNYVPAYQLKLNAPVEVTTLAGTVLEFPAQIRTSDLSATGADNAVATSRWPASNYQATASVTVLENPTVNATKTAPAGWPVNSTFSYVLSIENQGNTPLFGYFLSDQLPRNGVNGSEFDPQYGAVFIDAAASDVLVEGSTDSSCNSDPLQAAWSKLPLQPSSRTGYRSQSTVLHASTLCVRLRRAATGPPLAVSESLKVAIDIGIPDDVFLSGKSLFNKALVGVSDVFGGSSNISITETALVSTIVDGAVVLGASKSAGGSLERVGEVGWMLGYQNTSGTVAYSVTVTDTLPGTLIYRGLQQALPTGVSCTNGTAGDINGDGITDCALIGANADGSGGTLELTVDELAADDGNPGGGADQGQVGIWTAVTVNQPVENCVTSIPAGGVGGNDCVNGQLSQATILKNQTVTNNRTGDVPAVYFGETIQYDLTIANTGTLSRYLWLLDKLPAQLVYEPGSLIINGASASDGLFTGGNLMYVSPLPVSPGGVVDVTFSAKVASGNTGDVVPNSAVFMLCADRVSADSCDGARGSNAVQARIEGNRLRGVVFNDNGAGSAVAHDGVRSGIEAGTGDTVVQLLHLSSGDVVATGSTGASGEFGLYAALQVGEQYQLALQHTNEWIPVSHDKGNTVAAESLPHTRVLTFTHVDPRYSYESVHFGLVRRPQLLQDETRAVVPAQTVLIPHTYEVTTQGALQFDLTAAAAVTVLEGWQVAIYEDSNCDQQLLQGEQPVTAPINADPDRVSTLCFIVSVHTPTIISNDLQLLVPITATLSFSDNSGSGHGIVHQSTVIDTLNISLGAIGHLVLEKRVSNLSRAEAAAVSNTASPGEVLRYSIDFEVRGASAVDAVDIHDSTPAYTRLHVPVECPASVSGCVVIVPASAENEAGYSGPLHWRIGDQMSAGSSGSLSFDVQVED